jgi:hypothetical protein
MQAINLADKLSAFSENWEPRVAGQFDGDRLLVVTLERWVVPERQLLSCPVAEGSRTPVG